LGILSQLCEGKRMKLRKVTSRQSIRVVVVESDPLRVGGFRAVLECQDDTVGRGISSISVPRAKTV